MFDTTHYRQIRERRMKKTLILMALSTAILLVALLSTLVILNNANTPSPAISIAPTMITHPDALLNPVLLQKGTLTWGSDIAIGQPFLGIDPGNTNSVTGIEVDIMNTVARHLHLQATKFVQIPWTQMAAALHNHAIDLYIAPIQQGMVSPANATLTLPFMMTGNAIIVRQGDTRFTDIKSLQNAQVGFVTGNVDPSLISSATPIAYQEVPTESLASGRIDAILMTAPLADWYGGNDPQQRFHVLPDVSNIAALSMALPPQGALHDVLNQLINQAIISMIYDGTLKTIDAKWHLNDTAQNCLLHPAAVSGCPSLQP